MVASHGVVSWPKILIKCTADLCWGGVTGFKGLAVDAQGRLCVQVGQVAIAVVCVALPIALRRPSGKAGLCST